MSELVLPDFIPFFKEQPKKADRYLVCGYTRWKNGVICLARWNPENAESYLPSGWSVDIPEVTVTGWIGIPSPIHYKMTSKEDLQRMEHMENDLRLAVCIGCGCDDGQDCFGEDNENPRTWLRLDRAVCKGVCSNCSEHLERWDTEQKYNSGKI